MLGRYISVKALAVEKVEMNPFEKKAEVIIDLGQKVIEGKITLEEFTRLWPFTRPEPHPLEEIRTDYEDAILHTPYNLITGKLENDQWESSEERVNVLIDIEIMKKKRNLSFDKLAKIRHISQSKNYANEQDIIRDIAAMTDKA